MRRYSEQAGLFQSFALMVAASLLLAAAALAMATAVSAATPAASAPAPRQAPDYSAEGPHAVEAVLQSWVDGTRNRTLPLRILVPTVRTADDTRLPVILFSHGLGGSRDAGRAWGTHWASHGYLVIHLQHPGSDSGIWQGAESKAAMVRGLRDAMSPEQVLARVEDVKFVLDELDRRARAGDAIARRADLNRIGMSGHSFGAITTQALSGERFGQSQRAGDRLVDIRIQASIAFSPSGGRDGADDQSSQRFAAITRPFLSFTGTQDTSVASPETAQSRQLPYARMPGPDKYLLVLDGADHMTFGGQKELGRMRMNMQRGARTRADDDTFYPAILSASLAFWNASLKDDRDAKRYLASGAFERTLAPGDVWRSK
jgi:predicted dienelactone hydrolase